MCQHASDLQLLGGLSLVRVRQFGTSHNLTDT